MSTAREHRETGELVIAAKARRRELARRVIREDREVLERLAAYDRGEVPAPVAPKASTTKERR